MLYVILAVLFVIVLFAEASRVPEEEP